MKIKVEYIGKTIIKSTSLGNITIVVDNIDVSKYQYYVSIGMGYLFEESCINYESDEQSDTPAPAPKPKRKKPTTNGNTRSRRTQ